MAARSATRFCFCLALFVALLGFLSANAQVDYATATLQGTIVDPLGALVAGATVTVTNPSTGLAQQAKTGSNGTYRVPALRPGAYEITVEAPGFAKQVARGVELTVGQVLNYDVHMKLGPASETVEVSADGVPLIQTEQTQQANTISLLQINQLPNITHDFTQQVYTLPGVSNSNSPRSQQPGFTGHLTTGFSIGGSNGRNNLSTIDGGENEYGNGSYRVTTIPQDAIQEYQVNRNGFAAEFGFTNGSAINIVTKSGGNQYHGSGYAYFQNHGTSAQNFFNGIEGLPAAYNQNVYGGFTVGGPIKKNKFFFFLAYDYRNKVSPDYTDVNILNNPTVQGPSAAQTAYVNALKASGDPFLIGFANGITPGLSPLNNPALKKILTAENGVFLNSYRYHNALLRFDAQPNASNSINVRFGYSLNNDNIGNPDFLTGPLREDYSVLTTWTHTFNLSLLNQLMVQLVPKNRADSPANSPFQGVEFTFPNLSLGSQLTASQFGSSSYPYKAHQQRYQFEDNLTWTHGAHTFKLGASMRLADYTVDTALFFNNEFDFLDSVIPLITLAPAAVQGHLVVFNLTHGYPMLGPTNTNLSAPQSFVFGLPVDWIGGFNNSKWQGWGKYFGSFVQDSWRVNSRLTLNFGARFDYDGEPAPLGSNFYASPRLGFAWDPFGDHKTVIRAGGGIYVAPVVVLIPSYAALLDGSGRYINQYISILSPTNPVPAVLWGMGIAKGELPFGSLGAADYAAVGVDPTKPGKSVLYTVASNYNNPYTVQASLSVERQLSQSYSLEVGYNMYHGVHLGMPAEVGFDQINPGDPRCPSATIAPGCTDATGGPLYVLNSSYFQHTSYTSNGRSIYHGLTASLTKRYSNNLQFQVNYTFSKTLDDVIDFASFDDWFRPSQLSRYRAVSAFDVPHVLVANAVYTTPFKGGKGNVLKSILADISISPIVTVRSGLPFSVRTPALENLVVGGQLSVGNDQYFAGPYLAARDSSRGPVYSTADLSFTKSFYISRDRGVKLNFVAMGTNIFNRVNFNKVSDIFDTNGIPANGIVQTADGPLNLITGPFTGLHGVKPTSASQINQPLYFSSADLPRQIQFGLKLQF